MNWFWDPFLLILELNTNSSISSKRLYLFHSHSILVCKCLYDILPLLFQMVTHQHRIMMILDSLHIEFEVVDIAGAAMEEAKEFMRTNGKKKDNQRHVLPPQIFNGDKYCGVSSIQSLSMLILTVKKAFLWLTNFKLFTAVAIAFLKNLFVKRYVYFCRMNDVCERALLKKGKIKGVWEKK